MNRVKAFVLRGNTYGNLPALRAVGAKYDPGNKCWRLDMTEHPLNNLQQKKYLQEMLNDLEIKGVRFEAVK